MSVQASFTVYKFYYYFIVMLLFLYCVHLLPGKTVGERAKGRLEVLVKEARNLTGVKSNGYSDPFCKG